MDDKIASNEMFMLNDFGCVYRQVGESFTDAEPLYVFKLIGGTSAERLQAIRDFSQAIFERERHVPGQREFKVKGIRFVRSHGGGRGSTSFPVQFIGQGGIANLLRSQLEGHDVTDVVSFQVTVFPVRMKRSTQAVPQVQPSGSDIIAAVQRVERRVEQVTPTIMAAVQPQLSELHRRLLELTDTYEGNYSQAAQELGVPFKEAFEVVLRNRKN